MNFPRPHTLLALQPALTLLLGTAAIAGLVGCSAGAVPAGTTVTSLAKTTVPVLVTDAPSDQLLTFSLTLNSIVLTDTAGKTASILPTPTTIEACHLNGVEEALVTASIPQDTYASAAITYSSPEITYIDAVGQKVQVSPALSTTSYSTTFAAPITISSTSSSLLVDLLVDKSVTISGSAVTVAPVFNITNIVPTSSSGSDGHHQDGGDTHQFGAVVSMTASSLTIQPPSGAAVTLTANSATVFQGGSSLASLAAGNLVEVDFTVQPDGSLLATRVQLEDSAEGTHHADLLTGPVTLINKGTGFQITLSQCLGSDLSSSTVGNSYTITISSSTIFAPTPQFQNLTGLPFTPSFTAANLTGGQRVAVAASSISGTNVTASTVYLIPQTLDGTVTAITTSGNFTVYTFTLATGSAFTSLSGASSVVVYTTSITMNQTATPIAVGSVVRFNGLVFNDAGTFRMVSGVSKDGSHSDH